MLCAAFSHHQSLAKLHPEDFKPVFDNAEAFIRDTSFYANEAANKAPTLLPKLESWRDVLPQWLGGTNNPVPTDDAQAIRAPIFEGTLSWSRDEAGKPIRMADVEERAQSMTPLAKAQELLRRRLISPEVMRMWQGMTSDRFDAAVTYHRTTEVGLSRFIEPSRSRRDPSDCGTVRPLPDMNALSPRPTTLRRTSFAGRSAPSGPNTRTVTN